MLRTRRGRSAAARWDRGKLAAFAARWERVYPVLAGPRPCGGRRGNLWDRGAPMVGVGAVCVGRQPRCGRRGSMWRPPASRWERGKQSAVAASREVGQGQLVVAVCAEVG